MGTTAFQDRQTETDSTAVVMHFCNPISDQAAAGSSVLCINNQPRSQYPPLVTLGNEVKTHPPTRLPLGRTLIQLYLDSEMSRISSREMMVFNSLMQERVLMNYRGDEFIARPIDPWTHVRNSYIHSCVPFIIFFKYTNSRTKQLFLYSFSVEAHRLRLQTFELKDKMKYFTY